MMKLPKAKLPGLNWIHQHIRSIQFPDYIYFLENQIAKNQNNWRFGIIQSPSFLKPITHKPKYMLKKISENLLNVLE